MNWIQSGLIGCGIGATFVLIRDIVLSFSLDKTGATVFSFIRYAWYAFWAGLIGVGVNFLWNLN